MNWSKVTHAHGPAIDVPAYLRALFSDSPGCCRFAIQLLFETVWHQGTVYAATAPTVAFLYRLLQAAGVRDKASIAHLLAVIATGQHCALDEDGDLLAEIHERIGERLPLLFPYLRHPEPIVRASVADAIQRFPDQARLVQADLDAAVQEPSPYNALFAAVAEHNVAKLRDHLAAGSDVNERDPRPLEGNGCSALHLAAAEGQVEMVELLIEAGAEIDARCRAGWTPLMRACEPGKRADRALAVARMLLEGGADPSARNHEGEAPLDCLGGGSSCWGLLRLLLDAGASFKRE